MTSRPVPTTTPTGEPLTLGRLLSYLLPVLFPSPDVPTAAVSAAAAPGHVADSGASTSGAVAAKASGASAADRPNSLPHSASSSVQLQGTAADGGASPSASLQEAASASSMPSGSNSRLDGDTGGSTATATARDKIAGGLGEEGGIGGKAGSRSDGSDVGVKQQQLQPAAFHPLSAEVQQQTHGTNTAVCEMTQGGTSGTTSRSESPAGQASSSPTHQPAARSLSTATAAAAPGEGSALGAAVLPSTNSSSLGSSSEAQAATNTTCATPSTPAGFTHGACSHSPSTAAPPNAAAPCTQTMEGVGMSAGWSACWPKCRVVVAGIEPPLHAPLSLLHASLQSADTFLYVVVRMDV